MSVLLLGAGGFLGGAVRRALEEHGTEVTVVRRPAEPAAMAAWHDQLRTRTADAGPWTVVDAGWDGVDASSRRDEARQADNVARVEALRAVLDDNVATWIGFGSQAEYGAASGRLLEGMATEPVEPYGRAKQRTLDLLKRASSRTGSRLVWLRVFAGYGPGQGPGWLVPDAIDSLLDGRPFPVSAGHQRRDHVYVDDIADAAVAATTGDATGVFNIGTGIARPVREVVTLLQRLTGSRSEVRFGARDPRPGEVEVVEADIARAAELLHWRPAHDLESGLAETVRRAIEVRSGR